MAESIQKLRRLDGYKPVILDWLHDYHDMSYAQVYDWLLERYELYISVRSVSCYVNQLREEYAIAKTNHSRDYESTYV